jgi:hypothetical protein
MKTPGTTSSDLLGSIARRAMLERGLLPEYSAAALKQADAIAATAAGPRACHRTLIAMSCVPVAAGESWKPPIAGLLMREAER